MAALASSLIRQRRGGREVPPARPPGPPRPPGGPGPPSLCQQQLRGLVAKVRGCGRRRRPREKPPRAAAAGGGGEASLRPRALSAHGARRAAGRHVGGGGARHTVQPDPGGAAGRRHPGGPGRALCGHERRRHRLRLRSLHGRVPVQGVRLRELPRALRLGPVPPAPLRPRLVPGPGPPRPPHGRTPRPQGQGGRALPASAAGGGAVPGAVPARGGGAAGGPPRSHVALRGGDTPSPPQRPRPVTSGPDM